MENFFTKTVEFTTCGIMNVPAIPILYEDDDVIAIDKPAGLVVNRARSVKGKTIQDWAENRFTKNDVRFTNSSDESKLLFRERSGVVHRIDKETSGILLIAKHPAALEHLLGQFKNREVEKEYVCLAHGEVVPSSGTIQAPLGRLAWRHGLFGVMPGGKHAVTHYTVVKTYTDQKDQYSLLQVKIETGRTHQIRVHLQYIGHPVVGDLFYAGRKRTKKARVWCPRLFLHASRIRFRQPITGDTVEVESTLPEELTGVLSKLQVTG
ncbi:RluA family pseudouridine synthase [Candidatus Roizmanbacteria bacterium]|nr:RluA family pseudouridine synthase [Candidatus Roizmanbacteria bacterium]